MPYQCQTNHILSKILSIISIFFYEDHFKKKGFKYLLWHHTFSIPGIAPLGEVVDCSKLNEGREDKGIADSDEPVHSCGIGHFRERVPGADTECGHGQDSGHSCRETYRQDGYVKLDQISDNSVAIITLLCVINA